LPSASNGGAYTNLFTGEQFSLAENDGKPNLDVAAILAHCPVAVLVRSNT
jgi:hypothetical protein